MPTAHGTPLAAFFNHDALGAEIVGALRLLVLILAGVLIWATFRGDIRSVMQRAAIVLVAVVVVGLAGTLLVGVENARYFTSLIFNIGGGAGNGD